MGTGAGACAGLIDWLWTLQDKCHPQTIEVCRTRAEGLGLKVEVGKEEQFNIDKDTCGILLQYPATDGAMHDYKVRSFMLLRPKYLPASDSPCGAVCCL